MERLFKNISKLFVLALAVALVSCGGDDEVVLPDGPTITINSNQLSASASYEATAGETITFSVTVNAPGIFNNYSVSSGSGTPLTESKTAGSTETSFTGNDITINTEEGNLGTVTLTITAVDDNNKTNSVTVEYTVVSGPINSYTAKIFGAQGNSNPGFMNAQDGTLMSYAQARDASGVSSSTVDFAYYYGNTNTNTLASIDDSGLDAVYTAVNLPIDGVFGTKNSTQFKVLTTTAAEFDDIGNHADLQTAAFFEVAGTSSATGLAVDNVLAFKLDAARGGKFGLIKIVSVDDTNGNGTITIDVKVEM